MKYIIFCIGILIFFINKVYSECSFGICDVSEKLIGDKSSGIGIGFSNVIVYLLGFIGLIGVLWLMKGGFQILTSSGDDEKFKNGKKTVLFGLLGIFVILIAWAIVSGVIGGLKKV